MDRFLNSLAFYFEKVADVTTYTVLFFIALGYVLLIKPNKLNQKAIIKLGIVFVSSYLFLFVESGFMFALSSITNSFFFNYNLALMVLIYSFFVLKEKALTKSIKMSVLLAAICVVDVLSKYAGILFGNFTNIVVIVSIGRSFPSILFLLTCYFINRFDISKYSTFSKEILIICFSLSAVLIGASVVEHIYDNHDIVVCSLISLLDIVLLVILNVAYIGIYSIIQNRHKITNLEVEKTLVEAKNLSIAIDQNNREELEKLRHDLKNQLGYLNLLLKQNKKDEAIEYIDNYVDSQQVLSSFSCSNDVINSIIDLELTKAKLYGLKLDLKVVVPPVLPFDDNDVVSLLTNIIDNALENSPKDEKDSHISVCIIKQNDYIRFFVSNPIDISKIDKNNILKSRKDEKGHGYGTKIIRNITSKYNGYVDFHLEDNRFVCDAILHLGLGE